MDGGPARSCACPCVIGFEAEAISSMPTRFKRSRRRKGTMSAVTGSGTSGAPDVSEANAYSAQTLGPQPDVPSEGVSVRAE